MASPSKAKAKAPESKAHKAEKPAPVAPKPPVPADPTQGVQHAASGVAWPDTHSSNEGKSGNGPA